MARANPRDPFVLFARAGIDFPEQLILRSVTRHDDEEKYEKPVAPKTADNQKSRRVDSLAKIPVCEP
jgi:hypothetical protein